MKRRRVRKGRRGDTVANSSGKSQIAKISGLRQPAVATHLIAYHGRVGPSVQIW